MCNCYCEKEEKKSEVTRLAGCASGGRRLGELRRSPGEARRAASAWGLAAAVRPAPAGSRRCSWTNVSAAQRARELCSKRFSKVASHKFRRSALSCRRHPNPASAVFCDSQEENAPAFPGFASHSLPQGSLSENRCKRPAPSQDELHSPTREVASI